ncbi:MAG: hypothetical protein K9M81_05660 [Chthoniobacterales bacterium]|nr:hypothetical protein [Chthoniobacterales bacterium]
MQPSYFNPNIYNSFTFNSLTVPNITQSIYLGSNLVEDLSTTGVYDSFLGDSYDGFYYYFTYQFYSTVNTLFTQFSTYLTIYATDVIEESVTFNYRFGTELQTLYFSDQSSTSYTLTYENVFSEGTFYNGTIVYTYDTDFSFQGETVVSLTSTTESSGRIGYANSIFDSSTIQDSGGGYFTGSSTFVNMLGSNVYTGLLITTNSVIIYNNEQVSTYYSQSLSYQINIDNLTAALNSVSNTGNGSGAGSGIITVTTFSWAWQSLPGTGWTGSQLTDFPNYSFSTYVNSYLYNTYNSSIITNSSTAVQDIQSIITVQNNYLSNSQTFLNNAVTTLQSQVSLAGQIIGSLASATQSIITNMA